MSLPLVDLAAIQRELGEQLEAAVLGVIRDQDFVGGPRIPAFEESLCSFLDVSEAIGMGNGTDALEIALRALDVSPGAEVLVPANTFIATAEAVVAAGAVPRFVDVDQASGLIDLQSCKERLTNRTEAIIPVHLYGRMVDIDAVMKFAAVHRLAVVEDAAQAHGASRGGRRAGTVGQIGCFSFYPGKNLGAFGDAGAAVTNDPELAARMRLLRDHGRRGRNHHEIVGRNSRLDPIHAAVLTIKIAHIDRWNASRRKAAGWYREALPHAILDWRPSESQADVLHLFPVMVSDRDDLAAALSLAGVQSGVHYRQTLPSTPAFANTVDVCPVAERRARLQLSLPMHPHLTREDVTLIAHVVDDFVEAHAAV